MPMCWRSRRSRERPMSVDETTGEAITYAAALAELKEIVARIEASQVDVDELEVVVKRAAVLVNLCRVKLHGTQSAVELALEGLKEQPMGGAVTDVAGREAAPMQ